MLCKHKPLLTVAAIATASFVTLANPGTFAKAQVPGLVELAVSESDAEGGFGTLGAFTYDPNNDVFWTVLFGSGRGVRRIDPATSAENYITATPTEWFTRASDVPGGVTNSNYSGSSLTSAILLNPAAVTIDYGSELDQDNNPIGQITYQPGELAYIIDGVARVRDENSNNLFDITKRIYTYDLRKVTPGPTVDPGLPDRNNAQNGLGGTIGAYDQVDWNDVHNVLVTEADLRAASGADPEASSGSNFARQFAWSSDGQSLYNIDSGSSTGGIYKTNASTGALNWIYDEKDLGPGSNVIGEPEVIHTSVRSFGSGTGDQVLFDGTEINSNNGGISYILDDGTAGQKTAQVAVAAADITNFTGSTADVRSIASDDQGNLFFWENTNDGLFLYDTNDRLIKVLNRIELGVMNASQDTSHADSGGMLRLQVDESGTDKRVLYRGDNSYIGAVTVNKPGDFTGDDQITAADTAFFITQFNREVSSEAPLDYATSASDYLDYAKADVNSSGRPSNAGVVDDDVVDNLDLKTLRQFINLKAGDTDWDFDVDLADFAQLKSNFNPTATDATFFEGNFDDENDGNVDIADFAALKANFNPTTPYEIDPLVTPVSITELPLAAVAVPLGELALEIDAEGNVYLVGNEITFDSIQIIAAGESLLESNYLGVAGLGNPVVGDDFLADFTLGAGETLNGSLLIGMLYNIGLNAQDFQFTYNGSVVGDVFYVIPEPGTFALLGILGLISTRRTRQQKLA